MSLHFHHCHLQIRNIEESLHFFCTQLAHLPDVFAGEQS